MVFKASETESKTESFRYLHRKFDTDLMEAQGRLLTLVRKPSSLRTELYNLRLAYLTACLSLYDRDVRNCLTRSVSERKELLGIKLPVYVNAFRKDLDKLFPNSEWTNWWTVSKLRKAGEKVIKRLLEIV